MKKTLFALLFGLVGFVAITIARPAPASAVVDDTPDCDTVAIIKCGFKSLSEMRSDYKANVYGDLPKVYNALGVSGADLQSGTFKDGIVWRDGRVTINGKTVATGAVTAGRWNNPTGDMTRIPGTVRAYKMGASHFSDEGQTAYVKVDANGKFLFAVMKSCGNPVKATPVQPPKPPKPTPQPPKPTPKPVYSCDKLTSKQLSRTEYQFAAKATAKNGATIQGFSFDFGDNSKGSAGTAGSTNHTYAKPGTYTVRATADIQVNGKSVPTTGNACVTKVTIAQAPAFECTSLTATLTDEASRAYQFKLQYTATGGAKLTAINMDFGDGTITDIPLTQLNGITHNYPASGSFDAKATLTFNADGKSQTSACSTPITITTVTQPCQYDNSLPADSPDCQPTQTLVNTGSSTGLMLFGAVAVGISGFAGHFWYTRRRLL